MSAKRLQLVEAAFDLFYRKGVHAVGINEVLKISGVAKKTLYNHFSSKDELLLAVLEYRDDRFCEWLERACLEVVPAQASDRVLAVFDALDDWFNDRCEGLSPFRGCFFINVSGEYGDPNDPVYQQCALHKQRVRAIVQRLVSESVSPGLAAGQSERVNEKASLVDAICLLKEGAITQAYVSGDKDAALKAKKVARLLLVSGS